MRYTFKNHALLALAVLADACDARMGYVDAQTLLDDAHAYSASAVSTNTYDTAAATNDIGVGEVLAIEINVDVAADAAQADETYAFNVISSASANLSSPAVLNTITIGRATLVAGYKFYMHVPAGKTQRYVGLSTTLGGTTPSITITASIKPMDMAEFLKYMPKNYTIS